MKAIMVLIFAALYTSISLGQNGTADSAKTNSNSVLQKSMNPEAPVPITDYTYTACDKHLGMKAAGIVLTSLGGGLCAAGIGILAASNTGMIPNGNDNGYYRGTTPVRAGGAAAITIGGLSLGAGIPLVVIGSVKSKRTCGTFDPGRDKTNLELHSGENGMGLAVNF